MKIFNIITDFVHTNCKKSKDKTIPKKTYKEGKYYITTHCVEKMNDRKINKVECMCIYILHHYSKWL